MLLSAKAACKVKSTDQLFSNSWDFSSIYLQTGVERFAEKRRTRCHAGTFGLNTPAENAKIKTIDFKLALTWEVFDVNE